MSTMKRKFELIQRLQALGFSFEESQQLRRIELTLKRWAEAECNGEIQREETPDANGWDTGNGKPFRVYEPPFMRDPRFPSVPPMRKKYPIADREAGALRRLAAIVDARNTRACENLGNDSATVIPYHQTDPRGCMLYLVKRGDLPEVKDEEIVRHSGPSAISTPQRRLDWLVSQYNNRGLAVCC